MGRKSRAKKERKTRAVTAQNDSAKLGRWAALVLCLVPLLAYAHTIRFEFVWDDEIQVLRNPWIRDWSEVGRFFASDVWGFSRTDRITNYYRPLHMIAHALGYSLSGLEPGGYHAINIILHVLCTLLVGMIGLRLTNERSIAVAGGMVFALHPIHTGSVAWIAGVTDPLCTVFYLGALYMHVKDLDGGLSRSAFFGTVLLFLCALLSKEMAFTFPLVALWADWCLRRRLRWSRYAGMLAVFAFYVVLRVAALGQFMREHFLLGLNLYERAVTSLVLLAAYAVKLFVPYDLSAYHVFKPVRSIFDPRFAWGVGALSILGLAAWWRRKDRSSLFLFGFCFLTLVPLMNISGVGEDVFADRYLYLPSLGSSLLIPMLVLSAWTLRPPWMPSPRRQSAYILLAPLLVAYGAWTVRASLMWRDTPTLWTETLRRSPESGFAAYSLARYYYSRGDYGKAEPLFQTSIELFNKTATGSEHISEAYSGLGAIHFSRGRLNEASEFFHKAYRLNPNDAAVLQNLGSVNVALHNYPEALKFFQAALAANPRNEIVYNNLAALYLNLQQYETAIQNARKAIEIFPGFSEAYINMARAYAASGDRDNARAAYRKALSADPKRKDLIEAELKRLESPPANK